MKMLVVDDHAVVRQGLAALLLDSGTATQVVQAGDEAEGLAQLSAHPDLDAILLDLRMPGGDGMAAIGAFARQAPTAPIIIVSASEDPGDVRRALDLGALGYVPKSASPEALIAAVRRVLSGEIHVPALMQDAAPSPRIDRLTPRQSEILAALAGGFSNREIGAKFALSEKTVKTHISAIFRTLGVVNRTQAARAAQAAGMAILPPPAPIPAEEDW